MLLIEAMMKLLNILGHVPSMVKGLFITMIQMVFQFLEFLTFSVKALITNMVQLVLQIQGCLTFLVMGLIINLVQMVAFLLLFKIDKRLFRRLNYYLMYALHGYLLFLAEWWSGTTIKIYCDEELRMRIENKDPEENAIIVMNHHYELDWMYCRMIADRIGIMGNCRSVIKDSLKYLPVLGWAGYFSDDVYLQRNKIKDRDMMDNKLKELFDYPYPVWLFLYPEGTRLSQEKLQASQEFAEGRGLPRLKHHLVPKTKEFTFTISNLDKKRISTLYDFTLVAGTGDSSPPTLNSLILGRNTEVTVVIRKICLDSIPYGEKDGGQWMMNMFKDKDKIKNSLLDGNWQILNEYQAFTPSTLFCISEPAQIYSLVITIIANILVQCPLLYLLFSGGPVMWAIAGIVMIISGATLHLIVGASKVKKT